MNVRILAVVIVIGVATSALGCTSLREIRTEHSGVSLSEPDRTPPRECGTGGDAPGQVKHSIEDYGNYLLGFVEFDDQGWFYTDGTQMQTLVRRMHDELRDPAYAETGFLALVFVHGWHHNAHDNDCNVQEFRAVVRLTSERLNGGASQPSGRQRQRVIGIYVGWRGEAVDFPLVRYATIFDRRSSAEHVAKGSVRELFAQIRRMQYETEQKQGAGAKSASMRTIVIGHSFGGLIAYHSLAQALLNDLTIAKRSGDADCQAATERPPWPNQIILVNPAFEASRFEAIHRVAMRDDACPSPPADRPKLIVVTAENDGATGTFFPMFRSVTTIFEKYNATSPEAKQAERASNTHAIGFVERYRTHRLCLKEGRALLSAERDVNPAAADPRSPVWVVTTTPDIIDGHNGFLYARKDSAAKPEPYLLDWLLQVYVTHGSEMGECGS